MKEAMNGTVTDISSYIQELTEILTGISNGDLTNVIQREYVGSFGQIRESINTIVVHLGRTMAEVSASISQVSGGSKQLADGAQSLAQGATEQASAVEQLSVSIAEVSNSIKEAAASARQAAQLAGGIRMKAEHGSAQMGAMMSAVREINEASQSINKVIKVIDEIAFQTNLLALNAAVEAAHAGQHGHGFAVVAEEVRNLAARSAEAAKDTGSLIESSITKAELGVRIAGETFTSLSEILASVVKSSEISDEIARSADMQSVAIAQINTGVEQVAQVVQRNSATAQESAAASEQLSGQSAMLTELIEQFKLGEGRGDARYLSGRSRDGAARLLPQARHDGEDGGFGKY
jgi:methyl-accepting chemotaxis protein